ncbi:MAG: DNA mismatch repair protein MutS [Candidatus Cloacimonadota bacterium]|nr:MAG: DNA mismatch repair protein MutS [Candidatus Cloacimonadota bacterium]PIE79054.1 MAG: DNA mismatch repair protein MutS [Candidatus Delongbacteria bacterium]
MASKDKLTPMMKQYLDIKEKNPGHILFYRLGDFFEMFFDDAVVASKVLNITLTTRGKHLEKDIPLAGFPHHHLETYLSKMVKAGYKVAVCEQLEDPKQAKGVVKRGIVEVVSAGTAMSDNLLEKDSINYLCSFYEDKGRYALSFVDVSSGEFITSETESFYEAKELLLYFSPKEVLYKEGTKLSIVKDYKCVKTTVEEWKFDLEYTSSELFEYYNINSVKSLGIKEKSLSIISSGIILSYLKTTIKKDFTHLNNIKLFIPDQYVGIDESSRRNLELIEPLKYDGDKKATLFGVLNRTETGMGARILKKWILSPLKDLEEINDRLEIVEYLKDNSSISDKLSKTLSGVSDIERVVGRISTLRVLPPDLKNLSRSLRSIPDIIGLIENSPTASKKLCEKFLDYSEIVSLIDDSISEVSTININDGGFIKDGFSDELDTLRDIVNNGKDWILKIQTRLRDQLDLPNLKVGYNRVFGYYYEVTKKYRDKIPESFVRKQSLANSERFINDELKVLEEKILNADDKIKALEKSIFIEIREKLLDYINIIKANSNIIAQIDIFNSLAIVARRNNYTRPVLTNGTTIEIKNGRHPVVESILDSTDEFIPNNLFIDDEELIHIITGPNMSGKSTYLRQVALITLLAQMGSFIPADYGSIGVVDKIFTRVGASDNLAGGESTFLVEMLESANILNNATPKSLIILDEVGRGTSTFDGLSIAWSIVEYIHNQKSLSSRTLFATHYHELTEMERVLDNVINYTVSVREYKDEVIFLRKIIKGYASSSYGIYVGKLAGLPSKLLERADEILKNLEKNSLTPDEQPVIAESSTKDSVQLSLFEPDNDIIRDRLGKLDLNSMTPLEALNELSNLIKLSKR